MEEKTEKSKEEQIEDLIVVEAGWAKKGKKHVAEYRRMEVNLADDSDLMREIQGMHDEHPDASPGADSDMVLQLGIPKLTQLVGNIKKSKLAAEDCFRRQNQAMAERRRLQKEIDEARDDEQAQNAFEKLAEFLDLCQQAEVSLDGLRAVVFSSSARFFLRGVNLGFPKSHEVVFDSVLNREHLPTIGLPEALERIANLRDAYGPALIRHSNNRLRDTPLFRDGSVTPQWMEGRE